MISNFDDKANFIQELIITIDKQKIFTKLLQTIYQLIYNYQKLKFLK